MLVHECCCVAGGHFKTGRQPLLHTKDMELELFLPPHCTPNVWAQRWYESLAKQQLGLPHSMRPHLKNQGMILVVCFCGSSTNISLALLLTCVFDLVHNRRCCVRDAGDVVHCVFGLKRFIQLEQLHGLLTDSALRRTDQRSEKFVHAEPSLSLTHEYLKDRLKVGTPIIWASTNDTSHLPLKVVPVHLRGFTMRLCRQLFKSRNTSGDKGGSDIKRFCELRIHSGEVSKPSGVWLWAQPEDLGWDAVLHSNETCTLNVL
mmetsp:Transcript_150454/g.483553  ORF Transcript_150454/g.483553 Transcript_150454/m.483553 type:complete len:260 (+) Transcript_150454:3391-4170(+)